MNRRAGIQYLMTRTFVVHFLLISMATVLGVWATAYITEHVLVKEALVKEADYFWKLQAANPNQPRPNTHNLLGLLRSPKGGDHIPASLRDLAPGYQRVTFHGKHPLVYVQDKGNQRLYLIFDEHSVSRLAFLFGILPLTCVLLVIYLASFMTWRRSNKLLSPLVQLADVLRRSHARNEATRRPDFSAIKAPASSEVDVLIRALNDYADQLVSYVERERLFSRDASHELRTPLAVIRSNLELLTVKQGRTLEGQRIGSTLADMEAVIDTLLLLARNEQKAVPRETIIVNDLANNLLERLQPLALHKNMRLQLNQQSMLTLECNESLLTIVLTNLVRNAINYSDTGEVEVAVMANSLCVSDTGRGMQMSQLETLMEPYRRGVHSESGHGLGLAIVQRVCESCYWDLKVASEPGQGTRVMICFNKSVLS